MLLAIKVLAMNPRWLFDPQGLIGEWVHSQIKLHQDYGGVVPELASREHLSHLIPLFKKLSFVITENNQEYSCHPRPGPCRLFGDGAVFRSKLVWCLGYSATGD